MSTRVWKLQDFVAHTGRTHCARLGEKSGQVLATGGEDKRVNVWKVGKPNAMMSLTGHNTAVECLVFDKQEEVLVVGCAGGSIQVWNLEYKNMASKLTGHRTACEWVECHPYGEFFASGSADTNMKIWDLRQKACIQTYKGHTSSITSIRFSPHGRWVATGGQDSQVKIWDLTAGKLMRNLDCHKGPITSIAFHPKDYLLATGSADRTAKLWSLESFQSIRSTELSSSPIQAVKFYEEQTLLCASQESLRAFSTENLAVPTDTLEVDWKGLQDMRICTPEEKLIAVYVEASVGSQLGVWVADLSRKEHYANKGSANSRGQNSVGAASRGGAASSGRAGAPGDGRPARDGSAPRQRPERASGDNETEETFRPVSSEQRQSRQQPPPLPIYGDLDVPPASAPSRRSPPRRAAAAVDGLGRGAQSPKDAPAVPQAPPSWSHPRPHSVEYGGGSSGASSPPPPPAQVVVATAPYNGAGVASANGGAEAAERGNGPLAAYPPDRAPLRGVPADGGGSSSPLGGAVASSPSKRPSACASPEGFGLGVAAHPQPQLQPQPQRQQPRKPAAECMTAEIIDDLSSKHPQMMSVLQRRFEQARRLKEFWVTGDLSALSRACQSPQDHGVFCDFIRGIMRRKLEATLSLDACQTLLPIVRELMVSKYEDFALTSVQFAEALLENFGTLVAETRRSCAGIPERQLDFAREERLKKCDTCYENFKEIFRLLPQAERFSDLRQALHVFLNSC